MTDDICSTCHGSGLVTRSSDTKPRRGLNATGTEPCTAFFRCPTCPDDGSGNSKGTGRLPADPEDGARADR